MFRIRYFSKLFLITVLVTLIFALVEVAFDRPIPYTYFQLSPVPDYMRYIFADDDCI